MKKSTPFLKQYFLVLFSVVCLVCSLPLLAQTNKTKVSRNLKELYTKNLTGKAPLTKRNVSTTLVPYAGLVQIKNNYVLVEATAKSNCLELASKLEDLGLQKAAIFGGKVQGWLPIASVNKLDSITELAFIAPVSRPITNIGITTTQGDIALKSNLVREKFGVTGSGVKIGVLSDSYNSLKGADSGVLTGDLPGTGNPDGYSTPVEVLSDIPDGTDEGRAMMEIIHDLAPGANLAFSTANTGQVSFAEGIINLAADSCKIITDDISYLNEPFFQDGIIAQAVDYAVKNYGVSHYSSAGNEARQSYESPFRNGGIHLVVNPFTGDTLGRYMLHDFDPGPGVSNFQQVTFGPGGLLLYSLQWDDPFASVCEGCPGAKTDLDIFLTLERNPETVVLESVNSNVGADPFEILGVVNNDTVPLTAYIAIGKWLGAAGPNPNPGKIKFINFGDNSIDEFATNSPTCFGHSNSDKVTSVGATFWFRTPQYGVDPPPINYYSSVGGIPILFDQKGKKLRNPEIRLNPHFVATDGGNTSFFGQQLNDGDNFPNFFGTSAAAPHAAGVAALLTQMSGSKADQNLIVNCMAKTAIDMDDPFTPKFDKGYDFATGFGLIQADAAAGELLKNIGIKPISVASLCAEKPDSFRNWSIYNPNAFNVTITYGLLYGGSTQSLIVKPGVNKIFTPARTNRNILVVSWIDAWGNNRSAAAISKGNICGSPKSALADNEENNDLILFTKAFPNPFTDNLNIELLTSTEKEIYLNMYDVNGKLVYSKTYVANGYALIDVNPGQLAPGLYYLKLTTKSGAVIKNIPIVKN